MHYEFDGLDELRDCLSNRLNLHHRVNLQVHWWEEDYEFFDEAYMRLVGFGQTLNRTTTDGTKRSVSPERVVVKGGSFAIQMGYRLEADTSVLAGLSVWVRKGFDSSKIVSAAQELREEFRALQARVVHR